MSQTRKSIDPSSVESDGRYTSPKTWGLYKVDGLLEGKRFRFGNHPVRQQELIRQYGEAQLVGNLYEARIDAKEAAYLLNGNRYNAQLLSINAPRKSDTPFIKQTPTSKPASAAHVKR